MRIPVGQALRLLGIAMEMFGLASVATASRRGEHWFGMTPEQVWTIVIVGFVFWMTGTAVNVGETLRRRREEADEDDFQG